VKDGTILAVGSRAGTVRAHRGTATRVVDLAGKTLLPAFLDAHSHYFSSLTVANQVNVHAIPLETLKGMTINVANQYGEQASKGSLEAGKIPPIDVDPERSTIYLPWIR
jgi:predicted amidohydrolase YtcJ